jgi:hypothetical protein
VYKSLMFMGDHDSLIFCILHKSLTFREGITIASLKQMNMVCSWAGRRCAHGVLGVGM